MFCLPCVLCLTAATNPHTAFVKSSGFSTWHKIGQKLESHINCGVKGSNSNTQVGSMHSQNLAQAELFKKNATNPTGTLPHIFDKTLDE